MQILGSQPLISTCLTSISVTIKTIFPYRDLRLTLEDAALLSTLEINSFYLEAKSIRPTAVKHFTHFIVNFTVQY